MFHLLQTMKQVELNLVMRNPIEISNLIWVTQNFLKEEQTIYQHQKEKRSSENLTVVSQKSMDKNASVTNCQQQVFQLWLCSLMNLVIR